MQHISGIDINNLNIDSEQTIRIITSKFNNAMQLN